MQPVPKPAEPLAVPTPGRNWTVPGVGIEMIWIERGRFAMGSPEGETGRDDDETQHRVTLTKGFWLGKYPVTQRQWQELMGGNPSWFVTGKVLKEGKREAMPDATHCPVENVSWKDCVAFCRRLTEEERAVGRLPSGLAYALPTEAQWEYACRGGTIGPYAGTGTLDDMGWYEGNSGGRTHPVGEKKPNAWGLHDMHGNVWEWCADRNAAYPGGTVRDPIGPGSGQLRVIRGGSWGYSAGRCRSAFRGRRPPVVRDWYVGFRVCLAPGPAAAE